jgi:hypothetical protein
MIRIASLVLVAVLGCALRAGAGDEPALVQITLPADAQRDLQAAPVPDWVRAAAPRWLIGDKARLVDSARWRVVSEFGTRLAITVHGWRVTPQTAKSARLRSWDLRAQWPDETPLPRLPGGLVQRIRVDGVAPPETDAQESRHTEWCAERHWLARRTRAGGYQVGAVECRVPAAESRLLQEMWHPAVATMRLGGHGVREPLPEVERPVTRTEPREPSVPRPIEPDEPARAEPEKPASDPVESVQPRSEQAATPAAAAPPAPAAEPQERAPPETTATTPRSPADEARRDAYEEPPALLGHALARLLPAALILLGTVVLLVALRRKRTRI